MFRYLYLFENYSRIRPSVKMRATMVNVEDDTAAASRDNALRPVSRHSSKNLIAEKLLVPKIEPTTFVPSYWIIVTMITHVEAYNSADEIQFDLRVESSNPKNQCDDRLSLLFFLHFILYLLIEKTIRKMIVWHRQMITVKIPFNWGKRRKRKRYPMIRRCMSYPTIGIAEYDSTLCC